MENTAIKMNTVSLDGSKSTIANRILTDFMSYRRVPSSHHSCKDTGCKICSTVHISKIITAVEENKPVYFVLPAFPGKSPNAEKVLGPLPDFAESLALQFLGRLCQQVRSYYSPGVKIILCSDGRVFSDLVGMKEGNVSSYQSEISRLLKELNLTDILTFNLDDFYEDLNFMQMRDELMKSYGSPLQILKHKVRNGNSVGATQEENEAHRMYCGIARFLFEDSMYVGQTKSRNAIQKESRIKAYEVIRRSNAWSELIAERFPDAVRLSIHPQACGSKKLGIRLIESEVWMTPWHGVILETKSGYMLLKRSKAEALGAELVFNESGIPSHFKLPLHTNLSIERDLV